MKFDEISKDSEKITHEIICESKRTEITENPPFMQPLRSKNKNLR